MELLYLQEFRTVAEQGSFSKAADYMNTTQSTVSKHISSLEQELGVVLFDRTPRGITLTEAGDRLLAATDKITAIIDELNGELKDIRKNTHSTITVCSQTSLSHCGVMDAIWDFGKQHPEINVIPNDLAMGKINPFVIDNIDLAFCRKIPNDGGKFEYLPYLPDRLCAIVQSKHPLADKEYVTWEDLKNEDIIFASRNIYDVSIDAAEKKGIKPHFRKIDDVQQAAIFDMVRISDSITISGEKIYQSFATAGTVSIPIAPEISRDLYLVRRKSSFFSNGVRLFWKYIQDNYPRQI